MYVYICIGMHDVCVGVYCQIKDKSGLYLKGLLELGAGGGFVMGYGDYCSGESSAVEWDLKVSQG